MEEKEFELKTFKKNSTSSTTLFQEKCQLITLTTNDSASTAREFANFRENTFAFVSGDKLSDKKFD
jgi:hypothetical protein